jgi:hypothetical protein
MGPAAGKATRAINLLMAVVVLTSVAGCASTMAVLPHKPATRVDRSSEITLVGSFHNQQVETDGTIRVHETSHGTATVTLSGFTTTAADNLRLHLNTGALSLNSSGAYAVGAGSDFDIGGVKAHANKQTFEIHEPAKVIPFIHSATILNYTTTQAYGSARLVPAAK